MGQIVAYYFPLLNLAAVAAGTAVASVERFAREDVADYVAIRPYLVEEPVLLGYGKPAPQIGLGTVGGGLREVDLQVLVASFDSIPDPFALGDMEGVAAAPELDLAR